MVRLYYLNTFIMMYMYENKYNLNYKIEAYAISV